MKVKSFIPILLLTLILFSCKKNEENAAIDDDMPMPTANTEGLAMPSGTIYWVDASMADNSGDGLTEATAKKNIQAALDLATSPGDGVYIKSGFYQETHPTFTHMSDGKEPTPHASWLVMADGTKEKPIFIMAAPGHEGKVICDGNNANVGFHLNFRDYIVFRGLKIKNTKVGSIVNWGSIHHVYTDANLSVGVVVENCSFYHVRGRDGKNISHIACWASKDWVIRNNIINDAANDVGDGASGIQAYGVINALIEHNTISNSKFGVFWKDHYVLNEARNPVIESEIAYNRIKDVTWGINIGIRGNETCEAGINYFHHNIITDFSEFGIRCNMSGAYGQSADCTIENNIIDGKGLKGTAAISSDGTAPLKLSGNIILNTSIGIELRRYDDIKISQLTVCDYNVFAGSFQNIVDRYGDKQGYFKDLESWQEITKEEYLSVDMDNPDLNSILSTGSEIFTNSDQGDYSFATNSPALGLMPDGTNAGAYQKGSEVVGAK